MEAGWAARQHSVRESGEPGPTVAAAASTTSRSNGQCESAREMGVTLGEPSGTARGSSDRGAALVEMALVLPLLLMLLIGIFTTARAWQVHNVLDHAAREASRYGATLDPWDASAAQDVAEAEINAASISTGPLTWCVEQGSTPCGNTAITDTEQVGVEIGYPGYQLNFVFFSIDVDMRSAAFARYES